MPYIIQNSDSTITLTVADQQVDTTTFSLAMVGRSVSNYGQYFAQNNLRLLENFASAVQPSPSTRLVGQLWYDKTDSVLRVWNGSAWKRATNIIVDTANNKPTTAYAGDAFFNLTTNKLEIHNGLGFKESGYAGTVTNAYNADSTIQNPEYYGTRVRTLFLTDENDLVHPVLAMSYVNSSQTSPNSGTTQIGEYYETIMAIFSDDEFIIKTVGDGTATPVDGVIVNFAPELIEVTSGIAAARAGRAQGTIIKGLNVRAEYEDTNTAIFDHLYANAIGDAVNPVATLYTNDLNVNGSMTVADIEIQSDTTINGSLTIAGALNAQTGIGNFANIVVTANTQLSGDTNIDGNLTVSGLNVQSLGNASNRIESIFANDTNTSNVTVGGLATMATANVANLNISAGALFQGNLDVQDTITALNISATDVDVSGTATTNALVTQGSATFSGATTFESDITLATSSNINMTTGALNGNVVGNVTGDVTGTVYGSLVGDVTGNIDGDLNGNINGSVVGNVTGNLTGDVTGNVTGTVSQISVTNTTSTSYLPVIVASANTGAASAFSDAAGITFQPSTNTLAVENINSATLITFNQMSDSSITIDGFINEPTMASDSATHIPTQASVKAYVDSSIANANVGGGGGGGNISGVYGGTNLTGGGTSGTITINMATSLTGMVAATFSGNVAANFFNGTATSARYADLAEIYATDQEYAPGTVVKMGGSAEVTQTVGAEDYNVFGVISTDPAFLMNVDADGQPVAFTGRIPVRVVGKVNKGDRLTSSNVPGVAKVLDPGRYDPRLVIGRSLDNKNDDGEGLIEVVVGVK